MCVLFCLQLLSETFHIVTRIQRDTIITQDKMCVLFCLRLLSETFHIVTRIQRDTILTEHLSSCKVLAIVVRF